MALVGIYSFPKSGNTWLREIVAAAMGAEKEAVPNLHAQPLSDAVMFRDFRFFKQHAGRNLSTWAGHPLPTTHVIHIRRNPLDVFVSYLNFLSANVRNQAPVPFESVEAIAGTELLDVYLDAFIVAGHISGSSSFVALTGDYFGHNKAWMQPHPIPVQRIRYEDLLDNTQGTVEFLADWLGLSEPDLCEAIAVAGKRTAKDGQFFWKQKTKNYHSFLSLDQVRRFLRYRGHDCRAAGYDPDWLESPSA